MKLFYVSSRVVNFVVCSFNSMLKLLFDIDSFTNEMNCWSNRTLVNSVFNVYTVCTFLFLDNSQIYWIQ